MTKNKSKKVSIVMGSQSDFKTMIFCQKILKKLNIKFEKKILSEGAIWSIPPMKKHRIITLEEVILLEASTPEVDDVIRIEDDTLRGDGRINSEHI